jgi:hypothetical protein
VSYEGVFGAAKGVHLGFAGKPVFAARGARARSAGAGYGAPPARPSAKARTEVQRAAGNAPGIFVDADAQAELEPTNKLGEPLRDLATNVEKQGKDGNLTIGELKVVDYKVDVMVFLGDLSEKTLKALKELGFVQTGESKTVRLLIGTIDVRKLEDLAKLEAVIRVKPVGG